MQIVRKEDLIYDLMSNNLYTCINLYSLSLRHYNIIVKKNERKITIEAFKNFLFYFLLKKK